VTVTPEQRELSAAILALARAYQLRDRNRVCRHGITVSQCYALEHIAANPGVTVGALAVALGLDKSTTSRVVEGLRLAGLAEFDAETLHRREKPLAATARGVALNRRIHTEILQEHLHAMARFSPRDQRACRDLLQSLATRAACGVATREPLHDQKRPAGRRPSNRRNL
jgi:MarR family transcriptional regulator, 2-MHQ and catechol-resistance regulon repressor